MKKFDVIVIGAGPAGSTCAKACAEKGLKTLMLEKQGLPRDKVCSGMVMGTLAQRLIKQEFGSPPQRIAMQGLWEGGLSHPEDLQSMPRQGHVRGDSAFRGPRKALHLHT